MHLKAEDLSSMEIEFDSGVVPPPYSHIFKLKIGFGAKSLETSLDLIYTDREELSEEEIFDEGFSLDDDFHFKGEISKIWEKPLKDLYLKSKWTSTLMDEEGGISLMVKDRQGKTSRVIPQNQQEWQIFAQDLIQAIYETSKKELPLSLRYLIRTQSGEKMIHLTVKFSIRKVEIKSNGKIIDGDWDKTKELLSYVFLPDYDYSKAKQQVPNHQGHFIDCGDGYWHELGKGVVNIDNSFDAVSKIREGFQKLV
ncbi:hypothetical protein [Cecembia calidifontis]|jgi:hypothetical protein|uniref:Uncharacterized protein n=1 Tax=Cecembia calidifontis TaxID=1187080 RepID=A0A4Q7PEK0_9BACT|nr:hypothetical protein [Cecembia calidifontis]RZS98218.1 hypothetical protein BC751_3858 [Cecembia calidifontis]